MMLRYVLALLALASPALAQSLPTPNLGTGTQINGTAIGALPLGVPKGGSGVATLSGLVKGNGASPFSAAVAGTDYAPATSGNVPLKGNGAGGTAAATAADMATLHGGSATPLVNGTATIGTSSNFARDDHRHPTDTSRAAAGANSDITSLTGLTTPLSVAQGGVGVGNVSLTTTPLTVTWTGGTPTGAAIATGYLQRGKELRIRFYVFAGSALNGATSVSFTLPSSLVGFASADQDIVGRDVTGGVGTGVVFFRLAASDTKFVMTPAAGLVANHLYTTSIATVEVQ